MKSNPDVMPLIRKLQIYRLLWQYFLTSIRYRNVSTYNLEFGTMSQTTPEPANKIPNDIAVASFGTSSTTSYRCQPVVPFMARFSMLSNATVDFSLSTRIHSPAHPRTSSDFTSPLSRHLAAPSDRGIAPPLCFASKCRIHRCLAS